LRRKSRAVKAYEEQDCYDETFGIGIPGISELRRNTERATRSVPDNKEKGEAGLELSFTLGVEAK